MQDYNFHLIRLLQEEAESAREDAMAVRNSVRYRIGGLVIQALPPSIQSFRILKQLFMLFLNRRSSNPSAEHAADSHSVKSKVSKWVFSSFKGEDEEGLDVWVTSNYQLLAEHADKTDGPKIFVLRELSTAVVRRIARLQLQGWHIVWHPQPHTEYDAAMLDYVLSIANECRTGESV